VGSGLKSKLMARLSGTDGMVKAVAVATFVPGGTVAVGAYLCHVVRENALTAFLPAALMYDTFTNSPSGYVPMWPQSYVFRWVCCIQDLRWLWTKSNTTEQVIHEVIFVRATLSSPTSICVLMCFICCRYWVRARD